jgi:hypothetical protein
VWLEPESGLIVGMEVLKPEQALGRATELFQRATSAPMIGEPRMPRRLRVASSELARALVGRLDGVEITVAPTPEVDRMAATLFERMAASDREDERDVTYIGPGLAESDVARFFHASARLYRVAPWGAVPPDGFLSIMCPQLGIEAGALCVVGQAGESFGFAVFRSTADATAYVDACEKRMAGDDVAFPPHIMFSYDDRRTIGAVLAREVAKHGWELAGPKAYPSVVMIDSDLVARGLTQEELDGVCAIADTLARFTAEGRLQDAFDQGERITWKQLDGEVELAAPLSLLDEEDADQVRQRCFEALGRFAESGSATEHIGWLELIVNYSVDYMGAGPGDVSPIDLEELLFEVVPRKVSCEPEDAPAIVAALRAFLGFAADELASTAARENLASLRPDSSQKLARRLADPRNYGMAKALLMAATRAGFERSEAGLAAYLKTTNGMPLPSFAADRTPEPRRQADKRIRRAKRKSERKARKNTRKR